MFRTILLVGAALTVAGCGTVVRGTKQGVKFISEPPGATVTAVRAKKVDTRDDCIAPCELQLSRKRDFDVTFELDGYKPAHGRLASRLGAKGGATAVPGNFVLGGGIGFIVDAGTGANMQLKPDPMRATLAPIDSAQESVVYDLRVEGGGRENILSDADQAEFDRGKSGPEDLVEEAPVDEGFGEEEPGEETSGEDESGAEESVEEDSGEEGSGAEESVEEDSGE